MSLLREFKPSFVFLGIFLAVYFIGNTIYALYIESYGTKPDQITRFVAVQSSSILNLMGNSTTINDANERATVALKNEQHTVLDVFEGCNGLNVMIVFVAFLIAYNRSSVQLFWFIPAGLLLIHLFNLFRIVLLYYLADSNSRHFYYYHKYIFTATLYLIVFVLWGTWIKLLDDRK
jgi:exosortase family protein XrtF